MGKPAGGSRRGKRPGKRISPVPWGPEIEKWPSQIREFVQTHDAAEVYQKGLDKLGYPPTWLHTTGEAMAVVQQMRNDR